MIKRSGVELMNARTQNVSIAKETIEVIKQRHYTSASGNVVDITNSVNSAISGTILYKEPLSKIPFQSKIASLDVTNETTTQAAMRILKSGKDHVVALNFASARNVGGGFLGGAVAQEEDLSRASALYACLKSKPIFYNENILCDNTLYTNNIIYSPNVPFFRDEDLSFLENPYELSIISAPAPNVRALSHEAEKDLYATLYERAIKILQIAVAHNHENIILGAWGCGAFGNDPKVVSGIFKDALSVIPAFRHICFAIYDNKPGAPVFDVFDKTFQ